LSRGGLAGTFEEEIGARDYLSVFDQEDPLSFDGLRQQVLNGVASLPEIDLIVTTKGFPLRIDAGANPKPEVYPKWEPYSSLESELTRIDSIDTIEEMRNQVFLIGLPQFDRNLSSNPYFNRNVPFVRSGSDPYNGDIRLSARLDGYDILAWQREYSAPFEPSQSAVQLEQVPEPGAGEVLLAALVLLLLWQSVPSLQRHSEKDYTVNYYNHQSYR
jgi:hypothetical protein